MLRYLATAASTFPTWNFQVAWLLVAWSLGRLAAAAYPSTPIDQIDLPKNKRLLANAPVVPPNSMEVNNNNNAYSTVCTANEPSNESTPTSGAATACARRMYVLRAWPVVNAAIALGMGCSSSRLMQQPATATRVPQPARAQYDTDGIPSVEIARDLHFAQ
ncbi:hypothetical protein PG995_002630 [Apiospora arundinis]|uniref:Uncharacterized protein n=1 Tax=Apiospora arundinis TaxID=335852 RepID=A0ABR2J574_9PEZI